MIAGSRATWIALAFSSALLSAARAADLNGTVGAFSDVYLQSPLFPEQNPARAKPGLRATLDGHVELTPSIEGVFSARATIMANVESAIFADARTAFLSYRSSQIEARVGVVDERWGFLAAENPVDVFNQVDLVEDYQGDVHLGQPGAAATYAFENGALTLLFAPVARARRIPDGEDRFRLTALPLADAEFEEGRWMPSGAGRLYWRDGDLELALSHFHGHSREPEFRPVFEQNGAVELAPVYQRIDQTGLELQYVLGDYLLRAEAFYRSGQTGAGFYGVAFGGERIFYGFTGGAADLLVYAEGYYDDRPDAAPVTAFDNDLVLGGSILFNDPQTTELRFQVISDIVEGSFLLDLSAERRVGPDLRLGISLTAPLNAENDPALDSLRNDHRATLFLTRYF